MPPALCEDALRLARARGEGLGPYALQAAIASGHARAGAPEETDWDRIAALYEALGKLAPSPVVELNRAVAMSRAFGPAAGLAIVDALASEPALGGYHLLPAVCADLPMKLERHDEARAELERAISLTRNERERKLLLDRIAECDREAAPGELVAAGSQEAELRPESRGSLGLTSRPPSPLRGGCSGRR